MSMAKHMAPACRRYEQIIPGRDMATLDGVLADDGTDHSAPPEVPPGAEGAKRAFARHIDRTTRTALILVLCVILLVGCTPTPDARQGPSADEPQAAANDPTAAADARLTIDDMTDELATPLAELERDGGSLWTDAAAQAGGDGAVTLPSDPEAAVDAALGAPAAELFEITIGTDPEELVDAP